MRIKAGSNTWIIVLKFIFDINVMGDFLTKRAMKAGRNGVCLFFLLFVICFGCVPIQQQNSEGGNSKIDGFVGPLIIDVEEFDRISASIVYDRFTVDDKLLPINNKVTYDGTFAGKPVYILNCKCMEDFEIVESKLVFRHSYGGGGSNRERTRLLWNGEYYQNTRGEYIVDLVLDTGAFDNRWALIFENKILDVAPVQLKGEKFVWLNLLGSERLIKYAY
jgi:hypothetical protein